jgi:hypothetical protein
LGYSLRFRRRLARFGRPGIEPPDGGLLQGATLMIDHVILTVADFMRSIRFYE